VLPRDSMAKTARKHRSRAADRARLEYIIRHYVLECCAKETSARASELAQRLAANRTTLSRTVTDVLGRPLRAVMRDRQLEEAVRLLGTTTLSIDEIAARSAFGDRSTFFRAFRGRFGMGPHAYRSLKFRQQNATVPRRR
ncbi:MAG: helix-turn-helix domain-containing protein, partial [bacterium]